MRFAFLVFFLAAGLFLSMTENVLSAQDKGEIILKPAEKNTEQIQKKQEEQPQKPLEQAKNAEADKNYKRKIIGLYILFIICVIYLLFTYKRKEKRI